MKHILLAIAILWPVFSWAQESEERNMPVPLGLQPAISSVLQLENTPEGVRVMESFVLVNGKIIPKGTILRNLSAPVDLTDRAWKRYASISNKKHGYAREAPSDGRDYELKGHEKKQIETIQNTVWDDKAIFFAAMDRIKQQELVLTFMGPEGEIETVPFKLFEGMLLSDRGGVVSVLTVDKDSKAGQSGFKPQDKITKVNGIELKGDLATLISTYESARKSVGASAADIIFEVQRGETPQRIVFKAPPSLNSSFF